MRWDTEKKKRKLTTRRRRLLKRVEMISFFLFFVYFVIIKQNKIDTKEKSRNVEFYKSNDHHQMNERRKLRKVTGAEEKKSWEISIQECMNLQRRKRQCIFAQEKNLDVENKIKFTQLIFLLRNNRNEIGERNGEKKKEEWTFCQVKSVNWMIWWWSLWTKKKSRSGSL